MSVGAWAALGLGLDVARAVLALAPDDRVVRNCDSGRRLKAMRKVAASSCSETSRTVKSR